MKALSEQAEKIPVLLPEVFTGKAYKVYTGIIIDTLALMNKPVLLPTPHMGDRELMFVKAVFDTNWIAPVDAYYGCLGNP